PSAPPSVGRRLAAVVALVLALAVVVTLVVTALNGFPFGLLAGALLVGCAVVTLEGLRRRGALRVVLVASAVVLLVAALVVLAVKALYAELAVLVLLVAGIALAVRRVFEPVADDLVPAPRPQRPALVFNPKSGGGKATRFQLADEAAKRGIEAIELRPGDDLIELVRGAVGRGADALAAAGGDGTQALVATIAAEHDLPFACIPSGTRNHFALDLGVDRNDVVGALDAFVDGLERRVDLAEVNGRVFVNNVSMGVYASAVQRDAYRDAKASTLLDTIPEVIGTDRAAGQELRWPGPDGSIHGSTAVLLVSNNPYRLGALFANATRPRMDTGSLGVVAARDQNGPRTGRLSLWTAWSCPEFTVESDRPVPIGVDGEALVMEGPLRFSVRPGALRVRLAPHHPGGSPSSGAPTGFADAVRRLARIAAGRH
ncbi:MAG: diacylglycerol/lipid kinase family protein, partial [Microthrixaceae bacterium]